MACVWRRCRRRGFLLLLTLLVACQVEVSEEDPQRPDAGQDADTALDTHLDGDQLDADQEADDADVSDSDHVEAPDADPDGDVDDLPDGDVTVDPCDGVDCSGRGTCDSLDGFPFCRCDEGTLPHGLECEEVETIAGFEIEDLSPAMGHPATVVTITSPGISTYAEYRVWFGDTGARPFDVEEGRLRVGVPPLPPGTYSLMVENESLLGYTAPIDFEVVDFPVEPISQEELAERIGALTAH
jgi:hypothetical protein